MLLELIPRYVGHHAGIKNITDDGAKLAVDMSDEFGRFQLPLPRFLPHAQFDCTRKVISSDRQLNASAGLKGAIMACPVATRYLQLARADQAIDKQLTEPSANGPVLAEMLHVNGWLFDLCEVLAEIARRCRRFFRGLGHGAGLGPWRGAFGLSRW